MFKKFRSVVALSSLAVVCSLSVSLNAFAQDEQIEPGDGDGDRSCPSGSDGICRTKTEDGIKKSTCVDLIGSERANCNK